MAVLAALDRPDKVVGLLGIAAAPDFTTRLLLTNLSAAQKHDLATEGYFLRPSAYGEPYPITHQLIEESRNHLVMDGPIPLSIPVTLLHGMRDADVPFDESIELAQRLTSQQAHVMLRKMGDHRLSEPEDLDFMGKCLEEMLG
jgi:pimeloyl-ACP methyl ester carboxylesterase